MKSFRRELGRVEFSDHPADDEVAQQIRLALFVPLSATHHERILAVVLHRAQALAKEHLVQGSCLNHEHGKVLRYPLHHHHEAMDHAAGFTIEFEAERIIPQSQSWCRILPHAALPPFCPLPARRSSSLPHSSPPAPALLSSFLWRRAHHTSAV